MARSQWYKAAIRSGEKACRYLISRRLSHFTRKSDTCLAFFFVGTGRVRYRRIVSLNVEDEIFLKIQPKMKSYEVHGNRIRMIL